MSEQNSYPPSGTLFATKEKRTEKSPDYTVSLNCHMRL